jgi:chromosome segregation ATPase
MSSTTKTSTKTPPSVQEKKKMSKLERIFELQADRKRLKEENKSLRKELEAARRGQSPKRKRPAGDEEKLMAAMSALKRVTVKQEQNLCTLRSKAEERRQEIEEKDRKIDALKKENAKLKRSLKSTRKDSGSSNENDVDSLRSKMEDIQMSCTERETRNNELEKKLKESEEQVKSLQKQLDSARGLIKGSPSAKSIHSTADVSISESDIAKLRKDLAHKIERIVLLEFDLEMCKDELHELRQTRSSTSPSPHAQNYEAADLDGSFFSDLSDEDDDDLDDHDGWM